MRTSAVSSKGTPWGWKWTARRERRVLSTTCGCAPSFVNSHMYSCAASGGTQRAIGGEKGMGFDHSADRITRHSYCQAQKLKPSTKARRRSFWARQVVHPQHVCHMPAKSAAMMLTGEGKKASLPTLCPEATARKLPLVWKARLAIGRPKLWQMVQAPVEASHTRTCRHGGNNRKQLRSRSRIALHSLYTV